jgi:hypothetical protein
MVNMPNITLEFGKACKVKEFLLEMDKYYDVPKPRRNNKVSKVVTF